MREFFGVNKSTWDKSKNKLLKHFGSFYEYELEKDQHDRRKTNYRILKKLGEYSPEPRKGQKRDIAYENGIIDIISEDNVQTAANVARRLYLENYDVIKLNYTEKTNYENTRVNMRIMFGTKVNEMGTKGRIAAKIWCRKEKDWNRYIPLTKEEIDDFFNIYKNEKENNRDYELEILNDYDIGLIDKEELYRLIGNQGINNFIAAKETFKAKYGFYPVKVPVYEFNAWDNETILNKEFSF